MEVIKPTRHSGRALRAENVDVEVLLDVTLQSNVTVGGVSVVPEHQHKGPEHHCTPLTR